MREHEQVRAWLEDATKDMMPKMKSSAFVMSLYPRDGLPDPKFCMELGAALMMDKPILMIVSDNIAIPQRLRELVTRTVTINGTEMNSDNKERIQVAISEMLTELSQR